MSTNTSKHGESSDGPPKKRHRRHKDESRKRRKEEKHKLHIVDDDLDDDAMWVEKNIDLDGERLLTSDIPTADSLKLTSSAPPDDGSLPNVITESSLKRDEWMLEPPAPPPISVRSQASLRNEADDYDEPANDHRTLGGGVDFFSSLGTEHKKKPARDMPDPAKPKTSHRELNPALNPNRVSSGSTASPSKPANSTPGGPGSQWRMMRLRRVYETAEEDGLPVEHVAIERFGSLEAFEAAKEERRILDERESRKSERARGRDSDRRGNGSYDDPSRTGERRFMFTDIGGSGSSSRSESFRRPGVMNDSAPPTPPAQSLAPNKRLDSLRLPSQSASPLVQSRTPIPSVMTPPIPSSSRRALSPSSLNKLQAKVLRSKLMGMPNVEALEKEYEEAARRAHGVVEGEVRTRVEVLPTLDGMGRLYDVGTGGGIDDTPTRPGNRKKKEKFETRDPKTGELLRYNANDDTTTLGEMLRQEKFAGGMSDQKNLDAEFAKAIMGDSKFQDDLDYIDDNAEKLGRQKMRSDAVKRQFAVHDYKRTQRVLASCPFCFGEDDSPPKAPVIAMATRVYLSCTLSEELVAGHCIIVPIQHHLNLLEGDDDVWDEIRNFMKCLMRMFAEQDKGVIFYETVINLKWQKHSYIECVPLPWEQFEDIPQYFKESILASEAEWSQHKKLIDFSARPGGFRRAMVPNLPYFMVQFDYKGEKGYGHVIEGAAEAGGEGEEDGMEEGEKGGGTFPRYFAAEIIGNVLEVEPRKWRRPRKIDFRNNKERAADFRKAYTAYDWTGMIGKGAGG